MKTFAFTRKITLQAPVKRVYDWHKRRGSLQRLIPPWLKLDLVSDNFELKNGSSYTLKFTWGPLWKTWKFLFSNVQKNEQFYSYQIKGPFKSWVHEQRFKHDDKKNTLVEDNIQYSLHFGIITNSLLNPLIQQKLKRIFRYRHEILKRDLVTNFQKSQAKSLKIVVTGASGMIGTALTHYLFSKGHSVIPLSHTKKFKNHFWDPNKGILDPSILENVDAVVNLAGESIASRWTDDKKDRIYNSRIRSTKLLVKAISKTKKPPRVLINLSGISIYGNNREERLHEESNIGKDGFLRHLCMDWEETAAGAQKYGTRVVLLRTGMVLSPAGGALKQMLPAFKCALGGRLGSGLQNISWISIDDLLDTIYFSILNTQIRGPVNTTAPYYVTNFRFKQTLAQKLNRPAWFPIPKFILKLVFGEMAEETILTDLKVHPQKLLAAGFKFRYPRIDQAIKHALE